MSSRTPTQAQEYSLPLLGKTAVVTGASRGIGAGISMELARRGASVILGYSSPNSTSQIEDLAHKILALPHKPSAHPCRADLSSPEGGKMFVAELLSTISTTTTTSSLNTNPLKIDIIVNNAGTHVLGSLSEITLADYDAVYNVNVRGVILLTQALLPYLNANGRIINIGSVGARAGFKDSSLYCSTKAALEGLTRCWAVELGGNGTTVNCVNAGPVPSAMLDGVPPEIVALQKATTPIQNRLGTVEEIATLVSALAGPDGAWVSGQAISASGGCDMY